MVIHFFPTKIRELPSIYWGLKALIHARFGLLFDKSPFSGDEWATHRLSHPYIRHLVGQRPFLSDSDERRMACVCMYTCEPVEQKTSASLHTHKQVFMKKGNVWSPQFVIFKIKLKSCLILFYFFQRQHFVCVWMCWSPGSVAGLLTIAVILMLHWRTLILKTDPLCDGLQPSCFFFWWYRRRAVHQTT